MRKLWFNLILLSMLLLTSCSQTTAIPATSTNTPEKPKATVTPAPQQSSNGPVMECQVVSLSPTQGPTEASMFPPVSSEDWVLGNAQNPAMTLIEYSDFQ